MDNKKAPDVAGATGSESNNHSSSIPQMERFERAYMRFGWAIFPVKSGDKTPATTHGCHDATIDSEVFQKLCKGPHNDGLATGLVSGVWVLDVDVRHGGDKSLHQLINQYGSLPFTVQSRTQSGGQHIFFKWDPSHPLSNRANVMPGLDVRADGGYVVVPPSVGSQGVYEWIVPPIRNEIANAPEWLYELLETGQSPDKKDLSHLAKGVGDGARNVSMTQLLGVILGRGIDIELAWALAVSYNTTHVTPPLDEDELLTTFESIASRELRKREQRFRRRA